MVSILQTVLAAASSRSPAEGDHTDETGASDSEGVPSESREGAPGVTTRSLAAVDGDEALGSVLNGMGTPAYVTDTAGVVIDLNDQACELFETTPAAAVGEPAASLVGGSDTATDFVGRVLDTEAEIQQVEERISPGERTVPVERTTTPLYDGDGQLVGVMELNRDITEQVRERERTETLESYQRAVIDDLQAAIARLADGDLTVDPTVREPPASFEEIEAVHEEFAATADDLTTTVDNLRQVVESVTEVSDSLADTSDDVSQSTEEITASVDQIGVASEQLSDGAEGLATRAERASANVEELSASIEEISGTVEGIDQRSERAAARASDGVAAADDALDSVDSAREAAATIETDVQALNEQMSEVDEITEVIADIADQTDLLALNANIEAARAGGSEGGSAEGFAVVAEEVKSLAAESKESTDEVASIVEEATTQTATVVEATREIVDEVSTAAAAIERTVEQLESIDEAVTHTSDDLTEVRGAVESQAENATEVSALVEETSSLSQEITASVQQLSASVEQQSTAMDETARTAEELSRTSDVLHEQIDAFKLDSDEAAELDEKIEAD